MKVFIEEIGGIVRLDLFFGKFFGSSVESGLKEKGLRAGILSYWEIFVFIVE